MNYHIRVDARGIIVNNGAILLNEFNNGEYYNIPGGGVEPGESIKDAVIREVKEETGLDVEVKDMIYVLEYEPKKCEGCYGDTHKLSMVFRCNVIGDIIPKQATIPDQDQRNKNNIHTGSRWIKINDLKEINYVPYIHNRLMDYFITNVFTPNFIEEPLIKK